MALPIWFARGEARRWHWRQNERHASLRSIAATGPGHALVAADMHNDSLLQLEERANRLPVILTVPMRIFIMPTIFLIVGGPTASKLIDLLWR
jgi:pilus assembly protein TadC